MRIGIVIEPYEESHASGMGYAVLQTARHLIAHAPEHEYVLFSSSAIDGEVIPGSYTKVRIPSNFFGKLWFFFRLPKDRVDVLTFMLPLLPFVTSCTTVPIFQELGSQKIKPRGIRAKLVAIVRDRILMPFTLRHASVIIASSEATRADILRYYSVLPEKVLTIHIGFQLWEQYKNQTPKIDASLEPFFFFAGKVKPRKNVHGIVEAFISFKERSHAPCHLVIAGDYGGEYAARMQESVRKAQLESFVHFLGYVDNPTIYALYTRAIACVFPSFNEGFGMPILEAMSLGTPVITSNISSMIEVAGDAAVLVDPHAPNTIAQAMELLWSNKEVRDKHIARGTQRAKLFSWESTAKRYVEVFAKVAAH